MNQSAKGMLTNRSGELAVPFSVDGPVSDPSVKPDEKYLAGLFTKVVAQSVAGKVIDDVKNVVPNAADSGKKLIQGIFGR
jgi:hypothetical protein